MQFQLHHGLLVAVAVLLLVYIYTIQKKKTTLLTRKPWNVQGVELYDDEDVEGYDDEEVEGFDELAEEYESEDEAEGFEDEIENFKKGERRGRGRGKK